MHNDNTYCMPNDMRTGHNYVTARMTLALYILSSCVGEYGYEVLIQRGKGITVAVDQHVFVYALVVGAWTLNQVVTFQQLSGQRGDPHEGLVIFVEQIELTASFKYENLA